MRGCSAVEEFTTMATVANGTRFLSYAIAIYMRPYSDSSETLLESVELAADFQTTFERLADRALVNSNVNVTTMREILPVALDVLEHTGKALDQSGHYPDAILGLVKEFMVRAKCQVDRVRCILEMLEG